MTVSRQRGRSIDRERESEVVQPTGIPAHMRRQPSPPPRRMKSPSPPPYQPVRPANFSAQQGRRISRSPPPMRSQSHIVPAPMRDNRPMRSAPAAPRDYGVWVEPSPNPVYDYRHRSRSPVHRDDRHAPQPPFSGNMRGYRSRSRERVERAPFMHMESMSGQRPTLSDQWNAVPEPDYRGRGRGFTYGHRSPSPPK